MDLTQYKIEELIQDCNKKLNLSEIYMKNLKFLAFSFAFAAIICTIGFPYPLVCLFGIPVLTAIKMTLQINLSKKKKQKANQKLKEVAFILESYGIQTTKLRLQKAQVNSHYISCIINDDGATYTSKHDIVFEDRERQLKALKQVRFELYSFRIPFKHRIYGETLVINDSKKAKQLVKTFRQK